VIECKRFSAKQTVGRPALQKLHSAMHVKSAQGMIFVTTARFGPRAREFASAWNIELVDGLRLTELFIQAFPATDSDEVFHVMCAECGRILRFPLKEKLLRAKCPNGHEVYCDSRIRTLKDEAVKANTRARHTKAKRTRAAPKNPRFRS
jgi:hypothetical protein